MSNLWLTLEASAGAEISDTCREAVRVADRVGITVWFNFNGVKCLARPGDDPIALMEDWRKEMKSKHPHKIASA